MKENTRTAVFLLVAALVAAITFAVPPLARMVASRFPTLNKTEDRLGYNESLEDLLGTLLFPDFTDPLAATSLEVVRYNEQTGDRSRFEVAQVGGIWSIPSHDNYPADAKDHLAAAAADLIDLKILGVAGQKRTDHALYGVIDPTDKNLAPGSPGVGMKVVMKGSKDKTLVSMIVGKEDPDSPGLRYVRRTGQDVVLTVKLSTENLSTDFGDWIEKDLLKLNPWDLREIFIQDYSIDELQGHQLLSDEFVLGYDGSADPKWKLLANRRRNENDQWEDAKLAPDQQLNAQRLDAMQSALDDLKIVDVARKPPGLSADLAADKSFFNDAEALASLRQRGFYPASVEGKLGIYSNEGETRVLMKTGVEYVLRFGGITGSGGGSQPSKDAKQPDAEGVNRYLFVSAEFNPTPIPKPQLEPLPAEPPKTEAAPGEPEKNEPQQKKPETTAEPPKTDDAKNPGPTPPVEKKPEAQEEPEAEKKPQLEEKPRAQEKPEAEKKPQLEEKPRAQEKPETEKGPQAEEKPDAEKKPEAEKEPQAQEKSDAEKKADLQKQRERIEKENRRKQEEYDEQIAQGKKEVAQLNARFADWYYVISESVYDKIHLRRNDIIKQKEKKEEKPKADSSKLPVPTDTRPPDAFNPIQPEPKQP